MKYGLRNQPGCTVVKVPHAHYTVGRHNEQAKWAQAYESDSRYHYEYRSENNTVVWQFEDKNVALIFRMLFP